MGITKDLQKLFDLWLIENDLEKASQEAVDGQSEIMEGMIDHLGSIPRHDAVNVMKDFMNRNITDDTERLVRLGFFVDDMYSAAGYSEIEIPLANLRNPTAEILDCAVTNDRGDDVVTVHNVTFFMTANVRAGMSPEEIADIMGNRGQSRGLSNLIGTALFRHGVIPHNAQVKIFPQPITTASIESIMPFDIMMAAKSHGYLSFSDLALTIYPRMRAQSRVSFPPMLNTGARGIMHGICGFQVTVSFPVGADIPEGYLDHDRLRESLCDMSSALFSNEDEIMSMFNSNPDGLHIRGFNADITSVIIENIVDSVPSLTYEQTDIGYNPDGYTEILISGRGNNGTIHFALRYGSRGEIIGPVSIPLFACILCFYSTREINFYSLLHGAFPKARFVELDNIAEMRNLKAQNRWN